MGVSVRDMPQVTKLRDAEQGALSPGMKWPPEEHRARLNQYSIFKAIWDGAHERVLDNRNLIENHALYVAVNLPRNIVVTPADIMLGEPVTIEGQNVDAVTELWDQLGMQTVMYENALDTAWSGDGLFEVNRGEDGKAILGTVPAHTWFPVTDPDNVRDVLYHKLAWVRQVGDEKFLRVKEHHKGEVRNLLYVLKDGEVKGEAPPSTWGRLYDTPPDAVIETGIDDFLLVHVPNMRSASALMGRSDYQGLEGLISALDARLTQVDVILGKHSDPSWALPSDMFAWLEKNFVGSTWTDKLAELGVLSQGLNGEKPERITWDGQLVANFTMIDKLVEMILAVGEIDRDLIMGVQGDPSGAALRMRLTRTTNKVNRKWQYMKPAAEKVLELAALIQSVELPEFQLKRSDGLPMSEAEQVEVSARKVEAGLSSLKRERKTIHDIDDEAADALGAEIDAESDVGRNSDAANNALGRRNPIQVSVAQEELQ